MEILSEKAAEIIEHTLVPRMLNKDYSSAVENIIDVLDELYANIPENKRISYGRVYTVKMLAKYLHGQLLQKNIPVCETAKGIFDAGNDYKGKGVALGIFSFEELTDYEQTLPYFKLAASSGHWDIREFAQMFFREIIKKYPAGAKSFLLQQVKSNDANIRRFVSETLRPVVENKWFYKQPEYPLSILKYLFHEKDAYPRTSVGNNLSDLSRHIPDMIYDIIGNLADNGDKNSYWIAYRACRNLVKKDRGRVMKLLKTNEYKYKSRIYKSYEN